VLAVAKPIDIAGEMDDDMAIYFGDPDLQAHGLTSTC
jgi:hypothetical protein